MRPKRQNDDDDEKPSRPRQGPPLAAVQRLFAGDDAARQHLQALEQQREQFVVRTTQAAAQLGQVEAYLRGLGYAVRGSVAVNGPLVRRIGFGTDPDSGRFGAITITFVDAKNNDAMTDRRWSNAPMPARIIAAEHLSPLLAALARSAAELPSADLEIPKGSSLESD